MGCSKASFSEATHSTEAGGVERDRSSFSFCLWYHLCPAHLQLLVWLNCQLNTRCSENSLTWPALPSHNKPHNKPFTLYMVFLFLYWTLIILLELFHLFSLMTSASLLVQSYLVQNHEITYILCPKLHINFKMWLNQLRISLCFSSASELYFSEENGL